MVVNIPVKIREWYFETGKGRGERFFECGFCGRVVSIYEQEAIQHALRCDPKARAALKEATRVG